ncbi:MAG: hypothetical protein J6Z33_06700 [Lachnospiraceae bacterium]|nr:hypothetical protein [Lachnospiraceae bacterium]
MRGTEMKEAYENKGTERRMDLGDLRRREILRSQKARRRRERLVKKAVLICAFACAVIFVFGRCALHGKAEAEKQHKFKYYTSVQLSYGETLWSLSEKYMDEEIYTNASYIEEVKSINHIHDEDDVMAGKMLIVPYYSTEYIAN